jgi:hypothetical protein
MEAKASSDMATNENRIAVGLDQLSSALAQMRTETIGRIDRLERTVAELDTYWRRQSDLLGEALRKSDLASIRQVESMRRDEDMQKKFALLEEELLQLSNRLPQRIVELAEPEPAFADGGAWQKRQHDLWDDLISDPDSRPEDKGSNAELGPSHPAAFDPIEPETDASWAKELSEPDTALPVSTCGHPSIEQDVRNGADLGEGRAGHRRGVTDLRFIGAPEVSNLEAADRSYGWYLFRVLGALLGIALLAATLVIGKREQDTAKAAPHSPNMRTLSVPEPVARDPNDTLFVVEIPRLEGMSPDPQSAYSSPGEHGAISEKALRDMAKNGNPKANTILGLRALDDRGAAPVSLPEAVRYLKKAAEGGNAVAQFRLASLYEHGDGVTTDLANARHWYELSANQGNRKAMHNLAVFYSSGAAGERDLRQAAYWFAEAASLGVTDSQFNLAFLYEHGYGVTKSLVEAGKWYSIAARSGDKESQKHAELVRAQLGTSEQALISKAAKDFRAVPFDLAANVPPDAGNL